ncbi:hypothetical protein [Mesobacillus foraminis]|uniref:hypothetical protein n=1 Tax=Mesobacillus foraminis TaxID=279826 RepID=UPI001304D9AD|nr:hypothetical protein [Mesobacillus foraminis]
MKTKRSDSWIKKTFIMAMKTKRSDSWIKKGLHHGDENPTQRQLNKERSSSGR